MSGEELVEIKVHEKLDELSKKISSSSFEAHITLEGIFQGIERVIGDKIPHVFKMLVEKSKNTCIFNRINLKRRTSSWDEVVLLLCNGVVIGAHGEINGQRLYGSKLLEQLSYNVNNNVYSHIIIEETLLPSEFVKKYLKLEDFGETQEPKPKETQTEKKTKTITKVDAYAETTQLNIPIASTIPVETSLDKTKVLPRRPIPPGFVPPKFIASDTRKKEETEEKEIAGTKKPMNVYLALRLSDKVLDLSNRLVELAEVEGIGVSYSSLSYNGSAYVLETNVTRVGFIRKYEKIRRIAEKIASILIEYMSDSPLAFERVIVILRHGFDTVRVVKKIHE